MLRVVPPYKHIVINTHKQATIACAGSHVLDEAERSLHDALCVLVSTIKDSRVLFGGGWPEMQMAKVRTMCQISL